VIHVYRFEATNPLTPPTFLSEYRKAKILGASENYTIQSVWTELLLIYALSKHQEVTLPLNIKTTKNGKPYLDNGVNFSVTHSNPIYMIAVSEHEVGIDMEIIGENNEKLAKRFMSDKEYQTYKELNDTNKPYYLYQLWTAKEALIKMIGGSVTMDMKLIDTDLQLGRMTYNDEIYLLKQHMNERYVMSLVSKKTVDYTWHDVTETSLLDIY
jgi:phosphopantetheine--protein transferase-like protein